MAASDPKMFEALEALQMMECPVCLEVIHPPVFQCHNGHFVCSTCLEQISRCPTCRSEMPLPRIRNLLVESFVTQKCLNADSGCQVRLTSNDRVQHILNCEFRSFDFCRLFGLENAGIKCTKKIKKCDILYHMKNEHNLTIFKSSEAVISQEIDSGMENIARKWLPITFSAFNNHFFLNSDLIEDTNGSGTTLTWKCISAGSVNMANGFSVELTLFNAQSTHSLKWQGSIASVDRTNEDTENSLDTLSVPLSMLHQFSQTIEGLKWNTNIVIKQKPRDSISQLIPLSSHMLTTVSVASQSQSQSSLSSASTSNASPTEYKAAYKHILGKYKLIPGRDNDRSAWDDIIYSINGEKWTRKLMRRLDSLNVDQTFELGTEFESKYSNKKRLVTINAVAKWLLSQYKVLSMAGNSMIGVGIQIQEFKDNEMVNTLIYRGKTTVARYKKVGS